MTDEELKRLILSELKEVKENTKEIFMRLNKIESFIASTKGGYFAMKILAAVVAFFFLVKEGLQWAN